MKQIYRILALLLCCCMLLAGCMLGDDQTESQNLPEQEDALAELRENMQPPVLAFAYLGYVSVAPENGIIPWLQENAPEWMEQYPFAEQIPGSRIIGRAGNIYCIVPRDAGATMVVNRVQMTEEEPFPVKEELYRSENGEPILILDEMIMDTMLSVVITDGDGYGVTYYPLLGTYEVTPGNVYEGSQVISFGPTFAYSEFTAFQATGWYIPAEEELDDTFWVCDWEWALELVKNPGEGEHSRSIRLYTISETGEYDCAYTGSWALEDGFLVVDMAAAGGDGAAVSGRFPVLLSPYEEPWLWIGRSRSGEGMPYTPEDAESVLLERPMG